MRTFMLVLVFMPSMFSWTRPVLHAKRILDFLRKSPISNDLVTDLAAHYFFKYLMFVYYFKPMHFTVLLIILFIRYT